MNQPNIIETNPEQLRSVKDAFIKDGPDKLHILADFDRTLTKAYVRGQATSSLISILRDENYLTPDYPAKAKTLYKKYHAIETDPGVPLEEKKKAMREWWSKHFELLIASGLTKKDIELAMLKSGRVELREGAGEFLDILNQQNIPLIIMSSSGLGSDSISLFLHKENKLYKNIHIISNSFEWDNEGRAVAVHQPIVHMLNKDETVVKDFPCYSQIRDRKNVILLGDSEGDVGMIAGFDYDNLIKIGFLNEGTDERLEQFKRVYDIIIVNDGTFEYPNRLISEVIARQTSAG
ncbi:MAG: hypothetical protein PHH01_00715 [Patescibacteria group bacterium]|nr:hypothetical protein [Patescibacteria group bacterium]